MAWAARAGGGRVETIRVMIGTEPAQRVPQIVLEHSIRTHTSGPVDVCFVQQPGKRVGGTKFGFVRFLVPSLCDYRGRAIYLDADQLVLSDLRSLHDALDAERAIGVVHDLEGTFGGAPVEPRNETSVMVLDCARLSAWNPETLFERVVPNRATPGAGEISYRDFMRLAWVDPATIQHLDPRWNHYNVVRDDTKLVHFSHVREQPWKRPSHALTPFWESWLVRALDAGCLGRGDVVREVLRRHLHPRFLRHVW